MTEALSLLQSTRPDLPFGIYKRQQAQISRRRLYPVTIFYSTYALILLVLGLRSPHPFVAATFFALGLPVWTLAEYAFHRFVLHGHFAPGRGIIRRFMHERLDPLHWEHHKRPFDGHHINGELRDLLPLFFVTAPMSFVGPLYTLPMLLAGVVGFYVIEEWVHHSVHFYNFRDPYFRYMKRHHFYHHSPKGRDMGYGLTNGFWDIVFKTRYPDSVRKALYVGSARSMQEGPCRSGDGRNLAAIKSPP
jgi:sterol desaturase/sphingolipid hydroxylase (fatty acid hydroxylase superfamily)